MAETSELELVQGKTWEISGTIYAEDGSLLPWVDYAVRAKARQKYSDTTAAWEWICTTGLDGKYSLKLGAVASAAIVKGRYVSDIEVYHKTDTDIVFEAQRLLITVLPEATK